MREFIQYDAKYAGSKPEKKEFQMHPGIPLPAAAGESSSAPAGKGSSRQEDVIGQYGYEEDMEGKTGEFGGLFGM